MNAVVTKEVAQGLSWKRGNSPTYWLIQMASLETMLELNKAEVPPEVRVEFEEMRAREKAARFNGTKGAWLADARDMLIAAKHQDTRIESKCKAAAARIDDWLGEKSDDFWKDEDHVGQWKPDELRSDVLEDLVMVLAGSPAAYAEPKASKAILACAILLDAIVSVEADEEERLGVDVCMVEEAGVGADGEELIRLKLPNVPGIERVKKALAAKGGVSP